MITRLLILGVVGFLSCAVFASDDIDNASPTVGNDDLMMAANPRKDRRDDRQGDRNEDRDDRQDCRQDEGLVGHDKRECKHEDGGDGDEGDKEDKGDDTDA